MTITNGYATLQQFKDRLNPGGLQAQATDDTVIEAMIEGVSRYIDGETDRTFYARSETHYYDLPDNPYELLIRDDDLLTLTTLTNGDGTVITSTYYKLYPLNTSPKWKIILLPSSGYIWQFSTTGNVEAAISIVGTWGYTSSTPANIKEVCLQISLGIYQGRYEVPEQAKFDAEAPFIKNTLDGYKRWTPS